MIITQTPFRMSFFGGGTDFPDFYKEHGGAVISTTFDKYCYVNVRHLPRFFDYSTELSYSRIERVTDVEQINHPAIREAMKFLDMHEIRLTYEADLPARSGLGTSSILAGACVKAIADFTGVMMDEGVLFDRVLYMEQLMSTGGGWQDQAGGIVPGIKLLTSKPGAHQALQVEQVQIGKETKEELNRRFAVIYTGQRRLARNLLREVVGNYIGGRKESVEALGEMKQTAVEMKQALEAGNVDRLAELFNRHWELSLKLDAGATNLCIDQIFLTIEDLIDGKFIAGAGGGGFLQVIMKKGVSAAQLNERLEEVFQGTGAAVWDSELYFG